jgi:hypothetical protein
MGGCGSGREDVTAETPDPRRVRPIRSRGPEFVKQCKISIVTPSSGRRPNQTLRLQAPDNTRETPRGQLTLPSQPTMH